MILSRGIKQCRRLFSSTSSAFPSPSPVTRDDVDFVYNPGDDYMEEFMKFHGKDRQVFDKNTVKLWQDSFPNDYKFKLMCLKGTTRTIGVSNFCTFYPIHPSQETPALFMGFGWVDPEYRRIGGTSILNELCREELADETVNTISNINEPARRFWNTMAKTPEHPDVGSKTGEVGYNSFYNQDDLQVPDNLHFPDITVRDAREVPKSDIIAYDQAIHPYHRERYIISHLHDKNGFGKVAYDENGEVCGVGQAVIYPAGDCNVGPIYAESPRVAQAMFKEILKDITKSGKKITRFEVRSIQLCRESFHWIKPFLKDSCKHHRFHVCNLVYKHHAPKTVDFTKVYCPTHAQLFVV